MNKTKKLTTAAFLIALDIIFTRFFSFMLPGNLDRLSLQFVSHSITGYVFSPMYAGLVTLAGDILGMFLNNGGFSFNLGFSISAFLKGFLFSLILQNKSITPKRLLFATALVNAIVDLALNPLWLSLMYGNGYLEVLMIKAPIRFVWVFVSTFILLAVFKPIIPLVQKLKSSKNWK